MQTETMRSEPRPRLRANRLYSGDNGRIFCGEKRCAGMTALYSGRDLSGMRVAMFTPDAIKAWIDDFDDVPRCETCGKHDGRLD